MKNIASLFVSGLFAVCFTVTASAQGLQDPDQNPNYRASQQVYLKRADSINTWHSTTLQNTYKAIDYLADKAEARAQRKAARRELRLARARWSNYGYYDDYYYSPGYYNNYNGYYNYNSYYPYGTRNTWGDALWTALPLVTAAGLASWWWCH